MVAYAMLLTSPTRSPDVRSARLVLGTEETWMLPQPNDIMFLNLLAEQGYRVVSIQYQGFGSSAYTTYLLSR